MYPVDKGGKTDSAYFNEPTYVDIVTFYHIHKKLIHLTT